MSTFRELIKAASSVAQGSTLRLHLNNLNNTIVAPIPPIVIVPEPVSVTFLAHPTFIVTSGAETEVVNASCEKIIL